MYVVCRVTFSHPRGGNSYLINQTLRAKISLVDKEQFVRAHQRSTKGLTYEITQFDLTLNGKISAIWLAKRQNGVSYERL